MFGTNVFIDVSSQPCFTGDRVQSHENVLNLRKYICDISHAFTCLFECNKIGVNADHIGKFNEYCFSADSLQFIDAAYKLQLQRKAVLDWNATADDVTLGLLEFERIQQ